MYKIIVEKECGCFKRSELQNNIEMDSKDEALLKTIEMRDIMNNEFCKKHTFEVQERESSFIITMK